MKRVAMMHAKHGCSVLFLLFLVVLNIQSSIQHPLEDNLPVDGQYNRDDEGGSLTEEDFTNGANMVTTDQEVHDEDLSTDLFEGDITLNDEDRAALEEGIDLREVVGQSRRKWPATNGIVNVPYAFPSDMPRVRRAAVARVVQEFATKTCIRLVPRKSEQAYVYVNPDGQGCSSPLGRQGRKQTIKFGLGCSWGNLAHELMHSLGFFHEHTRSDRDNYITVHWNKIGRNWKHNFLPCTAYPEGCNDLEVGYDYDSIMHYGPDLEGLTVITPKKKGAKIGQREKLSEKDLIGINEHYGCDPGTIDAGSGTNEPGCEPDKWDKCEYYASRGLLACYQPSWQERCPTSCMACKDV